MFILDLLFGFITSIDDQRCSDNLIMAEMVVFIFSVAISEICLVNNGSSLSVFRGGGGGGRVDDLMMLVSSRCQSLATNQNRANTIKIQKHTNAKIDIVAKFIISINLKIQRNKDLRLVLSIWSRLAKYRTGER